MSTTARSIGSDKTLTVTHKRHNSSLLAVPEKEALQWMARRMPEWVSPDHLTLLGLLAMLACGASFIASRFAPWSLLLVVLFLSLNWFGDSLDGTLARVRNTQRPRYGFYVDHVVDLFGTFFLLAGVGLSDLMSPRLAAGLLVAYLMLSAEIYLATHALGTFRMSFWKMGPTELRLVLAAGAVTASFSPEIVVLGERYLLFDLGGVVALIGLVLTLAISTLRTTRTLYVAETVR